ncbi:hypothetical protein PVIIG_06392 [Plasmodium vivax India VII]|uniref:Schizont-infected cell agglutination C-terminal domain-containing protein n=1 Tax=Plasmodium vivax India VII TaxID=1077284 RepID=A0A0J9S538_PLAVI|nr:hypothetical protein PVIIG_06392 [Plasmodium vivax India VII]
MEDYCDERDELKGELHKMNILEEEKCYKFREWTIEYLVNFWNDYFWRKYITYKAMIKPFDIDDNCSVITLFDNVFDCENDGDIRFHLPARIRDKYPKIKRNVFKKILVPPNPKDKIVLEDKTPQSYVEISYDENSTREVPQLGKSPEIPDTAFYPKMPKNIQSTSVKPCFFCYFICSCSSYFTKSHESSINPCIRRKFLLVGGITIFILLMKPPHLEKVSELVERDNLEDMIHDIPYGYRIYKIRNNVYMPKKKKKFKKTIIDIHLEVLDECQKDQWELNKRDFQEIILDEFMKDANIVCSHSSYNDSIITNMCNNEEIGKEKTLWVNWIERNKGTLEEKISHY